MHDNGRKRARAGQEGARCRALLRRSAGRLGSSRSQSGARQTATRRRQRTLAHVWWRCRQKHHPAFEGADCIFLTVKHVQGLRERPGLRTRARGPRRRDRHHAGARLDGGHQPGKKPRRPAENLARAEHFQASSAVGLGAARIRSRRRRSTGGASSGSGSHPGGSAPARRAYGRLQDVPQRLASLSAFLVVKGTRDRHVGRGRIPAPFGGVSRSGPP
jgi:hypothetical protein